MQAKTDLAPWLGDWQSPADATPYEGEDVLGYWYDCDCPWVRAVYYRDGSWFDSANDEEQVRQPDAWAEVIYPLEGE